MAVATEINLDDAPPAEPAVAQSLGARLRRRRRPGHPAPVVVGLALALLAALLLTLAGAPPSRPGAEVVFRTTADAFELGDHHLYTIHSRPNQSARVTAHELPSGHITWHTEIPAGSDTHFMSYLDTRLVVTAPPDAIEGETIELDWQTGELLWRAPGYPIAASPELVVLRTWPDLADPTEPTEPLEPRFSAVDPTTGSLRWELPATVTRVATDHATDRWYGLDDDQLIRFDPATGEPLAATQVAGSPWDISHLRTIDSVVLVQQLDFRERVARLRAYDLESLALRWELDSQIGPDDTVFPLPCGDLLCLAGDGVLVGVDPATGERRWSADEPVRYVLWHAPAGTHPFSDHLVVTAAADPRGPQRLLAAQTGETVAALPDWRLLPGGPGTTADAPPLAMRESVGSDDNLWLGVLRPDQSGIVPVTTAGGEPAYQRGCLVQWPYLACHEVAPGAAPLTVWRVNPPDRLW